MVTLDFNNKNSYRDLDLILEKRPPIPLSLEKFESIELVGRSGTLTRKLGTYNDKVITCNFTLLSKDGLPRRIDNITSWLNYVSDNTLKLSYDADRVYKVKAVKISENIQEMLSFYGKFEVSFLCEAFKYPVSENIITKTTTSFTIANNGTVKSEPYLKIYGTGDITLTVNSKSCTLTGVADYIELDCHDLVCYKGTSNLMPIMSGEFPIFEIGNNSISLTGTITQVDILVNTRYL